MMAKDFEFEVVERYGTLSKSGKVSLELRKIRWNGGEEKYDIRKWNEEKPYKGVSLDAAEMQQLFILLGNILGIIDEEAE